MRLDTAFNRSVTIFVLIILVIIIVLILPSKEYLGIKIAGQATKDISLNETTRNIESVADTVSDTQTNIGMALLNSILKNPVSILIIIFLCVITGVATGWIGKLRSLLR